MINNFCKHANAVYGAYKMKERGVDEQQDHIAFDSLTLHTFTLVYLFGPLSDSESHINGLRKKKETSGCNWIDL